MIFGNKVGLRAIEKSDLTLMRDWRNIDSFRENFREFRELNLDNQLDWYDRTVVKSKNDFMFMIVDKTSGDSLGVCGLCYCNWINRSADFSFYIGHEGLYIDSLGIAEDAARVLIDYGFKVLNLNKIWMELYEFDEKKISFFTQKFGFKIDGNLRDNCYHKGQYWDSKIISLLHKEWK